MDEPDQASACVDAAKESSGVALEGVEVKCPVQLVKEDAEVAYYVSLGFPDSAPARVERTLG